MAITAVMVFCILIIGQTHAFRFSDEEEAEKREQADKRRRVEHLLSVDCREQIKNKKIAVIIGERHTDGLLKTEQSDYGLLFGALNNRLKGFGLRTYSQQEITNQIAQAEIEAYMNNDPDAAISASRRLGAQFILRGLISSRSQLNPVLDIKEVFVDMTFTLTDAGGRVISGITESVDSYSGTDTTSAAMGIVESKADEIMAKLYYDFCTQ